MTACLEGGWLTPDALLILEENAKVELDIPKGFTMVEDRKYGDTVISFFRLEA